MFKRFTYGTLLLALIVCALGAAYESKKERWDRSIDAAALGVQKKGISKYEGLLKRYIGTDQERPLRVRMIEAMEAAANLEFRIAHGDAHLKKTTVNYSAYHGTLKRIIGEATIVINKAPTSEENVRIYFVRAQAFSELKDIPQSKKDYDFIADHFPKTTWAIRSNLALAGYATEAANHRVAIMYLERVKEFPKDKHYPFAIYQLAWAHFNLNDIPTAIDYSKQHIIYYKEKREEAENKTLSVSERTYLEHSLKDVVTFYFEGFMKKMTPYTLQNALGDFRKIEEGPDLGKMLVNFAKLLRTRDQVDELSQWQAEIIDRESDRPESLEVVMVNLDSLYIRKSWDKVVGAAEGFTRLDKKTDGKMRTYESYVPAQTLILGVATALHKAIAEAKTTEKRLALSRILVGMYGSFTTIVEEKDPRLPQIHYNLGETLYSIKEFDAAADEYRWILGHWLKEAKLKKDDVSLKAIASRYQSMDAKKMLPKDLKPSKLSEDSKAKLDDLKPLIAEWITWVDAHVDDFGRGEKAIEQFEFETNRILYVNGQTNASIERMMKQIKKNTASPIAMGGASLILDTYVFDKQWALLLKVSEQFLDMPKLGDAPFRKRLESLPPDASFKLLEMAYQEKNFKEVLEMVKRYEKKYPTSPRMPECLFLASRSAEQLQELDTAMTHLSQLLTRYPNNENRTVALLARASIEDQRLEFDAAAKDYTDYLASAKKVSDRASLIRRLFVVSWLSKAPTEPKCEGMPEKLEVECDRFRGLSALALGKTKFDLDDLVKKALSGDKENRAIWAAVALTIGEKTEAPAPAAPQPKGKKAKPAKVAKAKMKTIGYRDRLSLAHTLATGSQDLDPFIQFVLVPIINRNIPEVFSKSRATMARIASLEKNTENLARRIELIKAMEIAATKVVVLPWARVKILVLNEIGLAYEDFCTELAALKPPPELTPQDLAEYKKGLKEILDPFREKGKSIRGQVLELAAEFPVGPHEVAGFKPSADRAPASKAEPIDLALLTKFNKPSGDLYPKWEEAVKARAWARAAFFFQTIKEKSGFPDTTLSFMRAVSLSLSGAQPEAIGELETIVGSIPEGDRNKIKDVLRSQFLASTATKKAAKYEVVKVQAQAPEQEPKE